MVLRSKRGAGGTFGDLLPGLNVSIVKIAGIVRFKLRVRRLDLGFVDLGACGNIMALLNRARERLKEHRLDLSKQVKKMLYDLGNIDPQKRLDFVRQNRRRAVDVGESKIFFSKFL